MIPGRRDSLPTEVLGDLPVGGENPLLLTVEQVVQNVSLNIGQWMQLDHGVILPHRCVVYPNTNSNLASIGSGGTTSLAVGPFAFGSEDLSHQM